MHSAFTIHTMQITQVKHLHRIIRKYTKHYFCYCVPHFPPYFLRVENLGLSHVEQILLNYQYWTSTRQKYIWKIVSTQFCQRQSKSYCLSISRIVDRSRRAPIGMSTFLTLFEEDLCRRNGLFQILWKSRGHILVTFPSHLKKLRSIPRF